MSFELLLLVAVAMLAAGGAFVYRRSRQRGAHEGCGARAGDDHRQHAGEEIARRPRFLGEGLAGAGYVLAADMLWRGLRG